MISEQPTAIVLFGVVFHVAAVLVDDQVFTKALNGPVKLEFLSAMVAVGRGGKNLNNQQRIKHSIPVLAGELRLPANHAAIGVGVKSNGVYFNS